MKSSLAFRVFVFFGWVAASGTFSFAAPVSELRRITVSGVCQREVTPDRGAVTLTAEARDSDLKVAAQKATSSYERVRDAIKKLNLQDLELRTVEYTMGEVREWENQKNVFKGFRSRLGLRVVTSQVDKLGEVISLATREGLKEVGGLQSFLSERNNSLKKLLACRRRLKMPGQRLRSWLYPWGLEWARR